MSAAPHTLAEFKMPPVPPVVGGNPDPTKKGWKPARNYSPSQIRTALECRAKYRFQYVEREAFVGSAEIQVGSWIDFALNLYNAGWLAKGTRPDVDEWLAKVEAAAPDYFREVTPEMWADAGATEATAKAGGLAVLRTYAEKAAPTFVPRMVQAETWIPAGVVGPRADKGIMDLLTTDRIIVDYKAPKKGLWKVDDSPDLFQTNAPPEARAALLRDVQMVSYGLMYLYSFPDAEGRPEQPGAIAKVALLWKGERPVVQYASTPLDRTSARWILAAMRGAMDDVEHGRWWPNPLATFCSSCDYSKVCRETYGA